MDRRISSVAQLIPKPRLDSKGWAVVDVDSMPRELVELQILSLWPYVGGFTFVFDDAPSAVSDYIMELQEAGQRVVRSHLQAPFPDQSTESVWAAVAGGFRYCISLPRGWALPGSGKFPDFFVKWAESPSLSLVAVGVPFIESIRTVAFPVDPADRAKRAQWQAIAWKLTGDWRRKRPESHVTYCPWPCRDYSPLAQREHKLAPERQYQPEAQIGDYAWLAGAMAKKPNGAKNDNYGNSIA